MKSFSLRPIRWDYLFWSLVLIGAFLLAAHVSQRYSVQLRMFAEGVGVTGIIAYMAILASSIVIAPINTTFLIPVAAQSWGAFAAAVYTVAGWCIGSLIAFYLARTFGLRIVGNARIVARLRELERAVPRRYLFLIMVFLRMAFPVDVLSYALGIFSTMSYSMFFWTTLIGISPFAFMFAYASVASAHWQVAVILLGVLFFAAGSYYVYRFQSR